MSYQATSTRISVRSSSWELRVKDEASTVRVFYAAGKFDAIIVFHVFQKKSQKTPVREIDLARRRFREVLDANIEC